MAKIGDDHCVGAGSKISDKCIQFLLKAAGQWFVIHKINFEKLTHGGRIHQTPFAKCRDPRPLDGMEMDIWA